MIVRLNLFTAYLMYNSRVAGRVDVLETQQTKILRLSPPLFDHPINKQTINIKIMIHNYFRWKIQQVMCPKIVIRRCADNCSKTLDYDSFGFQP